MRGESRQSRGKGIRRGVSVGARKKGLSADSIVKAYQVETARQQDVVRRAHLCETQLLVIISGLTRLLADENFVTLLRAESLDTLPQYLAAHMNGGN